MASEFTKKDLIEMSKADRVDYYARIWFRREPWYLTEKRIRKEVIGDDSARVPDGEYWEESQDRSV